MSVPANIAEGSKRISRQDYARFINIAEGSLAETEYFLFLARDLGYIEVPAANSCFSQIAKIAGMLHALRKKVEPS